MRWAVLFDMNGVLVDDEALHQAAFKNVLKKHGFFLTEKDYKNCFAGRTDADGFRCYLGAQKLNTELASLLRDKADAYHDLVTREIKGYPGAIELVRELSERGVPLAVVTSALPEETQTALEFLKIVDRFSIVLTANDVVHGKPEPDGYLLAAQRLGMDPKDCVVIEDAPSGILAAHAAGMACMAVTTTHDANDLRAADIIVDRLNADCASILEKIFQNRS